MDICEILKYSKTIAVVGISSKIGRISRTVAEYLSGNNYTVYGINPNKSFTEMNGIPVFNNLSEVPGKIDIVDVFRKSEDIPTILEDVIAVKPKILWMQLGIEHESAAEILKRNGIQVIQNRCIKIEHGNCSRLNLL